MRGERYGSALYAASSGGDEDIFFFLVPFISFEASLIQDNTSKVANERSFMVKLSIGPEAWEVPNRTNIPESVGMEIQCVRA